MVKLQKTTIKSKKTGKDYTCYYLEAGDFKTQYFFPDRLTLDDFYKLWQMTGGADNE